MASLQLTELLIEAALHKLKQGLPARIATINAEAGPASAHTEVTISVPSDDDYYPFGSDQIPRCPAIVVTEGSDGAEFTGEGPHSLSVQQQIHVAVIDEDPQRQRLGYKLLRLRRAVIETMWDDDPKEQLPNPEGGAAAAYHLQVERVIPGRVFDVRDDETAASLYRQMSHVLFRAWRVED